MSSRSALLKEQIAWAKSVGFNPDARGYLARVGDNLCAPLSVQALRAFEQGSGSELMDTPSRPAKMKALHSSSALAVNVFDYWSDRDAAPILPALGYDGSVDSINFEAQFPTGLTGNPPNLDIAIKLTSGITIAIESKFSEWLTAKSDEKAPFKPKYFSSSDGRWCQVGLPACESLATDLQNGHEKFRFLDAPQLLKHALGLVTQLGDRFALVYLYYDWPGPESDIHKDEITRFAERVGDDLRFNALTYQGLFAKLSGNQTVNADYLDYLHDRYFR